MPKIKVEQPQFTCYNKYKPIHTTTENNVVVGCVSHKIVSTIFSLCDVCIWTKCCTIKRGKDGLHTGRFGKATKGI